MRFTLRDMENQEVFVNREISWLSFNERVLQEAMDESNPIVERVRFLGIFSNNRDEFFRVRVASVRRMLDLGKKARQQLYDDPKELLKEINEVVVRQEDLFLKAYKEIVKELKNENVHIVDETNLSDTQKTFALDYFKETVRPALVPLMLMKRSNPDLTDKSSYLAIKMLVKGEERPKYALIEVPARIIPRFLVLPQEGKEKYVMFLDDVIRLGLGQIFKIFSFTSIEAYAVRMTRDAELDIDEDIDESVMEKLSKSINRRKKAQPVRFVHDKNIPDDLLEFLIRKLGLTDTGNIISSGKYHNLRDFMSFPDFGIKSLTYRKWIPVKHPELTNKRSLIDIIAKKDIMLNYPFQSFSHTIDILREAAIDPKVTSIRINMYRIAKNSKIVNALINASKNGKDVTVVMELRARFDEEHNMLLSRSLQENGVRVIFGVEGLKVHCKLIVIERKARDGVQYIAHIGTGNFHEGTARLYTDISLWTGDQTLGYEVSKVFDFFNHNYDRYTFNELIISPFNVREKIQELIDNEIDNAISGKEAYIILKLNNLVDEEMIRHLYRASQEGVKIRMIIRGICSLVPGVKGLSENIEVVSILDRYLEHSRVMVFANGGDEKMYITSADWMGRNLDRRIEIGAPVYNTDIRNEIRHTLELQLKDNCKARIIDEKQENKYKEQVGKKVHSQKETWMYFKSKFDKNR